MLDLATEFGRLDDRQREAVRHEGNTVVLAGPGSGKTATLVIKAVHLLTARIPPPRGLACITYNNDTVSELRSRLGEFGLHPSRRFFLGTAHSFCLNCVLRPYATLVMPHFDGELKVAAQARSAAALRRALDGCAVDRPPSSLEPELTRLRRCQACEEDVTGFDPQTVQVCSAYLGELHAEGRVDFEGMVIEALGCMRTHSWIRELIVARFPWLIVDEYQDLGGALHGIVSCLVDCAGMTAHVVGDPDQTIYPFVGANPKYLIELSQRPDFHTVRLRFNYRSGKRLIAASQAALSPPQPRDYHPDPERADQGEVYFEETQGGLAGQARNIASDILPRLIKAGVPLEETAILYRRKGKLLQLIVQELDKGGIPFIAEREGRYPRTPFVRWLQACAAWCLSSPAGDATQFRGVLGHYCELRRAAGKDAEDSAGLAPRIQLFEALYPLSDPAMALGQWWKALVEGLDLRSLLEAAPDQADALDDLDDLELAMLQSDRLAGWSLQKFADDGRVRGRAVVTTLHSSKGRQFDAVIVPGLQESLLPFRRWNRRTHAYDEPAETALREERRLFYVGFTRARHYVFLVYSPTFENDYGYTVSLGPSRFVREIQRKLSEGKA